MPPRAARMVRPMKVAEMKRAFDAMSDQPLATRAARTPPIIELSNESKNIPAPTRRSTRQGNGPVGKRSSRAAALAGLFIVARLLRVGGYAVPALRRYCNFLMLPINFCQREGGWVAGCRR